MAYANIKEFNVKYEPKSLGRPIDDMGGNDSFDKKLEQFLNDAAGFMDSFFASRYTLPLVISSTLAVTTGAVLRRANLIIAKYDLEQRLAGKRDEKTAYDKIVEWLEKIRAGAADLPGASIKSSSGIIESNQPLYDPINANIPFQAY